MDVVNKEDYKHASRVWAEFGIKDLGSITTYT